MEINPQHGKDPGQDTLKLKDGVGTIPLLALFPDSTLEDTIIVLKNHFFPFADKIEISESLTTKLEICVEHCLLYYENYKAKGEPIDEVMTEVLRALRWCATDDVAALNICSNTNILRVLNMLILKSGELHLEHAAFVKVAIQVLLNLLSGSNEEHKKAKRAAVRSEIDIVSYINLSSYSYEVSALLYNIYCDVDLDNDKVLNYVLKSYSDRTNEYLDMLMEKIVHQRFIWQKYKSLPISYKLSILHFLSDSLLNHEKDQLIIQLTSVSEECLNCLTNRLIESGSVVFQASNTTESAEEVAQVLELLAHLSSQEQCLTHLSANKDLFINTGVLLINAHRLGQCPDSVFTPVQKLADLQNPSENIRTNPIFGFKAHLIKLIGNLCWKNKIMQDLAREAELIPVLLDCCNVDAKNPFIMQWAIFAIRNICDQNHENQKIIAGMTQKQFISTEVLKEFGLTLHAENGIHSELVLLERSKF